MKIIFASLVILLIGCQRVERPLTLYTFLSTECPLSMEQTGTINTLYAMHNKNVNFKAVFPNATDSDSVIDGFVRKYKIEMEIVKDPKHHLKDSLNAWVTPQYFLLDEKGNILYSGQCDNRMISLGKKRKVVTEHYLEAAIEEALTSWWVFTRSTEPVGCTIFKSPAICKGN